MHTQLILSANAPLAYVEREANNLRADLLTVADHPRAAVEIAVKSFGDFIQLKAECYLEPETNINV